ncbi:MAG: hypothetical protein KF789_08080 [Bdellovibrionaceae bacterium]|nr:hypothetical protein [Pseudobdellovibrionaceae bacterium]
MTNLRGFLFILLSVLLWMNTASAQLSCNSIWAVEEALKIDNTYVESVRKWNLVSKSNFVQRFWRKEGLSPEKIDFDMQAFIESREFRTWFEYQNRVLPQLAMKSEPVPARVKLLADPQRSLAAKLFAIREAKHTIDVAYYILRNDQTGLSFIHEIKQAIQRGVSVRFLVDSTGTIAMTPHSDLRALIDFANQHGGFVRDLNGNPTAKRATVEVVVFNALSKAPSAIVTSLYRKVLSTFKSFLGIEKVDSLAYSWNRRSHDKILLIDGAFPELSISFIGGRNMSDHYYGMPKVDEHTYIDFEVMIRGVTTPAGSGRTAGTQMSDYFDQIYFHLGNGALTRSLLGIVKGYEHQNKKSEAAYEKTIDDLALREDPEGVRRELLELGFEEAHVDIVNTVHNLYRSRASRHLEVRDHRTDIKNAQALMARVESLIKEESKEVQIISPYLWLSNKQIRLLKSWLLKDPARRLTIVTNSIMTSDNMPAQILVDNVIGPALMNDPGVFNAKGDQVRRSVADQVKIYQYGRLDATTLGGKVGYGKMHAKGLLLMDSKVSVIGTFNNDPRSLLLNSEGAAVVRNPEIAGKFEADIQKMIKESHLWGSEEYYAIRQHPQLGRVKNSIASFSEQLYGLIMSLKLWWLI